MTPIDFPIASVFVFMVVGVMLFGAFLTIMWIGFRLLKWPICLFWYAIKGLIDT